MNEKVIRFSFFWMGRSFLEILCGIHKFDRMIIQMGAMTLSVTTLNIMTFNITINKKQHSAQWQTIVMLSVIYAECHI